MIDAIVLFYFLYNMYGWIVAKNEDASSTLIVVFIYLVIRVGRLLTLKSDLKREVKREQSIIKRLRKGEYTSFEEKTIRKVCHKDLFPYYFMYSSNNSVWTCLSSILDKDEQVTNASVIDFSITGEGITSKYRYCLMFITTKNKIIFLKITGKGSNAEYDFIMEFPISKIRKIDYRIKHKSVGVVADGIYSIANLELEDESILVLNLLYARTIEIIKDKMWEVGNKECLNESEMQLDYITRQLKKVEELYREDLISVETFEEFNKRASMNEKEANEYIIKKRMGEL